MGTRGKLVKALQIPAMRLARRYNPYSLLPSNRLEYAVGTGMSNRAFSDCRRELPG